MYVFKKRGKKKNKYGMIPQNYNRSTNVAMEHNLLIGVTLYRLYNKINP